MNFELILSELQTATTFDLYRLNAAINRLLEDPSRLNAVKRELTPGMNVSYFDARENRLIPAQVLEVRRTRVSVQDLHTGKQWTVPLYMVNVDNAAVDIPSNNARVDRLSLRTGDQVGFIDKNGREIFGTVIKLNPKRAKIKTAEGQWTVPYSMLFTVIDGELASAAVLPAQFEVLDQGVAQTEDGSDGSES